MAFKHWKRASKPFNLIILSLQRLPLMHLSRKNSHSYKEDFVHATPPVLPYYISVKTTYVDAFMHSRQ